jgi:hypothetical protein
MELIAELHMIRLQGTVTCIKVQQFTFETRDPIPHRGGHWEVPEISSAANVKTKEPHGDFLRISCG